MNIIRKLTSLIRRPLPPADGPVAPVVAPTAAAQQAPQFTPTFINALAAHIANATPTWR